MNDTISVIKKRVSLRSFSSQSIDEQIKEELFYAAMSAPTAGNQMLYSMLDICDQNKKEKLAVLCDNQPFIAKAPMVVVFLADQQRWVDYYDQSGVKEFCKTRDALNYEAPQESDLLLACEDAMCAAQTMVLAAESLNIGSCYIGDVLENHEQVYKLLNLPRWTLPIAMLVFGYYPDDFERKHHGRFNKKYIVFKDEYKRLSRDELSCMFKVSEQKYYNKNNKYGAQNFAQQFYLRKTGAAFSKEMARSVKEMLKNWQGGKR